VPIRLTSKVAASPARGNHDEAQSAFQQGKIRSLSEIIAEPRPELGGEVIEVGVRE
jgi:hypothetical protein